jgi:aspartate/methionine/tyrosine aminotransferase
MVEIKASNRLNGIGEYYFSQKLREIDQMNRDGKNVLNLGIGSPDLPPSPSVKNALMEGLEDPNFHRYQSYKGIPELRQAFSDWYRKFYGAVLDPDSQILPLIGSKEGITHLSMSLLNEGDEVLVPNPGYPTYSAVTKLAGASPIFYNLRAESDFYPDLEELENHYDLSKVKLMWINYPHMPTGAPSTSELLETLVAFSRKHRIVIVNDNPYSFILSKRPMSILSYAQKDDLVLELNSLSKSHNMAGWRMGMIGGNPGLIQTALTFKSQVDSGMFKPIMLGSIEALGLEQDWFDQLNTVYRARRELVIELVDFLGCEYNPDQVGMFIWAKVPKGNGEQLSDKLLYDSHVFVPPGKIFGTEGIPYIRFSLCSPETMLKEALNRIKIQ